jgi:tetratricopeptide (TPR) repeat protein
VELQAKRRCHELTLDVLERVDVDRYLALEFPGHAFPAELAGLIHAKTEGNPLFMADLVRYLANKGAIVQHTDGQWAFDGSLDVIDRQLPESVRAMIERKIAQLNENDRLLLTAASVQGHEFDSAVTDPNTKNTRPNSHPLFEAAHEYFRAAEYYRLAAQRAAQLFASQEAAVLASRGAGLLKSVPDTHERRERELALPVSLGNALIATRGYAAEEVLETYTRAHGICRQLDDTPLFPAVLYGIAGVFLVRGHHPRALEYTTELLTLCKRHHDPTLIVGHRLMGQPLLAMGRFEEARMHLATASELYDPLRHRALAYSYGLEPGMAARIFLAITLLRLGRENESLRYRDEALELGRQTPHANSECCSLLFAAMYDQLRGDRAHLLASTDAVLKLATDQGLPLWLTWGAIFRGWAIADRGELGAGIAEMQRGLDGAKAIGAGALHPPQIIPSAASPTVLLLGLLHYFSTHGPGLIEETNRGIEDLATHMRCWWSRSSDA